MFECRMGESATPEENRSKPLELIAIERLDRLMPFVLLLALVSTIWDATDPFTAVIGFIVFVSYNLLISQLINRSYSQSAYRLTTLRYSISSLVLLGTSVAAGADLLVWVFGLMYMPTVAYTLRPKEGAVSMAFIVAAVGASSWIADLNTLDVLSRMVVVGAVGAICYVAIEVGYQSIEEMRKTNDQLRAANKAKSDFLTTMSHEIRTPLNGVIGMAQLLESDNLDPDKQESLFVIKNSGRVLLRIIDDILDLSKVESGTLELEEGDLALDRCVRTVTDMISVPAAAKNLDLIVDIESAARQLRIGDPTRVSQILLNLCSNAVKFTEHGSIRISLRCGNEPDQFMFSVQDTGIGMEESVRRRIFRSFTPGDASLTRKQGGTGLGLVIAKKLVKLMNGNISVDSKPGEGSIFKFDIRLRENPKAVDYRPFSTAHQSTSNPPPKDPQIIDLQSAMHARQQLNSRDFANSPTTASVSTPLKNPGPQIEQANTQPKILLVEDNVVNQRVATMMLGKLGFTYDVAENGQVAVDYFLSRSDYVAVLMDCDMPVMDGFEATRAIRKIEAERGDTRRVPIIALTAHVLEGARERCLESGMNDFLTKPVNRELLAAALKRTLNASSVEFDGSIRPHASSVGFA